MKPYCLVILMQALLCAASGNATAQDSSHSEIVEIPSKYFDKVSKKADALDSKIDATSAKALQQLQSLENSIDFSSFYYRSKGKSIFADAREFLVLRDNSFIFEIVCAAGDVSG